MYLEVISLPSLHAVVVRPERGSPVCVRASALSEAQISSVPQFAKPSLTLWPYEGMRDSGKVR